MDFMTAVGIFIGGSVFAAFTVTVARIIIRRGTDIREEQNRQHRRDVKQALAYTFILDEEGNRMRRMRRIPDETLVTGTMLRDLSPCMYDGLPRGSQLTVYPPPIPVRDEAYVGHGIRPESTTCEDIRRTPPPCPSARTSAPVVARNTIGSNENMTEALAGAFGYMATMQRTVDPSYRPRVPDNLTRKEAAAAMQGALTAIEHLSRRRR